MVTMPSECGCYFEMKGYRALASAGTIQPHTAPTWSDRLTVLDPAEPADIPVTAADWTTYRHDAQRSNGDAAQMRWRPLTEYRPRQFADLAKREYVRTAQRAFHARDTGIERMIHDE